MSLSKLAIEMRKRLEIASIEDYLEVNEDPVTSRLLFETTRANAILDKNKDKVFMQHLNITNRTMAEKASLAYDVPYFLALPISLESVGELVSALKDACKSYKCTPPRSWDDVINGIHNTTNTKEFIENEDEPRFAPEL